jgi:hypothetical protein
MNKYPIISKVVSTVDNIDIILENLIPDDPNFQKIPLTVSVVPHNGKIFLHFSGMAGTHIEVEHQSANGLYVSFVK